MEGRNATYGVAGKQNDEDINQYNDWRLLFVHSFADCHDPNPGSMTDT